MEKKKLKLENIKVDSFITNLNNQEKETIVGAAAAGSWLVSDCLLSLRCSANTVIENKSNTWTLSPQVGLCQTGGSRNAITQLDPSQCPDCVRRQAPAPQQE